MVQFEALDENNGRGIQKSREIKPAHRLIRVWKKLIELPQEDEKTWNKVHFAWYMKEANLLLDIFKVKDASDESLAPVADCIVDIYTKLNSAGLECNLHTVVKKAHDWKNGRK